MKRFSQADLAALGRLNILRAADSTKEIRLLEERFESEHGTGSRLAVYGTLAPGRSNHHQVADLEGEWLSGLNVRGRLFQTEWGSKLGYPALRWSISGDAVPIELLVSQDLTLHWDRLDAFEGPGYRRVLVPVFRGEQVIEIANIYECASEPEDATGS